jgi:hypothetical protein
MRRLFRWFRSRFHTFDLLPEYFTAATQRAVDILWGVALPFLVWMAYSLFKTPAPWINWLAMVAALFLAGYYVWRADHVRLLPKLEISEAPHLQETPVEQGTERRIFVQIEPKCLTDSPVVECLGHLLEVYKKWGEGEWELTDMKERLLLEWSHYSSIPITLYPSGGQYLNICWRTNNINMIIPACNPRPSRWREVFDGVGTFRFDIEITAANCSPVRASVMVNTDLTEWNKPKVTVQRS